MTFSEFEKSEHAKRVAHFVNFIDSIDRAPEMIDCITIFGFCRKHAEPIFVEAVAIVAEKQLHHAYTGWFNGADFKEYFKLRAEEGGSLVFEIADYEGYCIGAREAHDEAEAHFGENV